MDQLLGENHNMRDRAQALQAENAAAVAKVGMIILAVSSFFFFFFVLCVCVLHDRRLCLCAPWHFLLISWS